MSKMTTMDAAAGIIESEGVRQIFGILRAGILPFYRSIKDLGTINHMVTVMRKAQFTWQTAMFEPLAVWVSVRLPPVRGSVILSPDYIPP